MRSLILASLAGLLIAAPASAFMGDKKQEDRPPPTTTAAGTALTPRQQAESWYADAYDVIAQARKDVEGGNAKAAEKKFKKALDRALRATEYDTTYHEAWNLVGYANRKLGKYDQALAAYGHCLRLKPGYVPAREYLGETQLEMGHVDKAKEQLVWLERQGEELPAKTLRDAIDAWEKAHPAPAAPSGSN